MEDLRKELDQVVMEIGRVRAGGEGDIEALRERKADIEQEITELKAEKTYREAQAQADAEAEHQAEISAKLEKFSEQTESFKTTFTFVESALKNLENAAQEFTDSVNSLNATGNPLLILGGIWKDLHPEKQAKIENMLFTVFDLRGKVPQQLAAVESLEKLNGLASSLFLQLGKFRVKPTPKPQARGMRTTTRKNNAPKSTVIMPHRPPKVPVDHGQRPVPRFDKNRPKGQQLVG